MMWPSVAGDGLTFPNPVREELPTDRELSRVFIMDIAGL